MKASTDTYKTLVKSTREFFKKAKVKRAVIGLSGGVDSSLCAAIVADAINPKNLHALILPDFSATEKGSIKDAISIAKKLKIKHTVFPIEELTWFVDLVPWKQSKIAEANNKARIRMLLLYNYANSNKALVIGTSNRSELLLGYFTKHGDGAADLLPIGMLYKTEVLKLARSRRLPKRIISKTPSAELWPGQTDEAELGVAYSKIDCILQDYFDNNLAKKKLLRKYGKKAVSRILARVKRSAHKRAPPTPIQS